MNAASVIFALTYLLVSLGENSPRKLDRPTATLLGAILMVVTGSLSRAQAVAALDFQTLVVLFGMMVLLAVLMQTGLPSRLATRAIATCRSPYMLLALVIFTSGIASALVLNDTVCLLATPLLVEITDRAQIPPLPFLIALATGSNIGSVMTLTGNPQNIIIGHASGWQWWDFAVRMVPIGLVCLGVCWAILRLLFRRTLAEAALGWDRQRLAERDDGVAAGSEPDRTRRTLAFKSVVALAGLTIAFLLGAPMDVAAVSAATLLLVWANRPPRLALEAVDWSLLLFFAGLFVVVEGFVVANGPLLATWFRGIGDADDLISAMHVGGSAIIGSNLFSNVPFVLIAGNWAAMTANPRFTWMLLALTSTFAGNLTLFGSVANVIVAQGAQRSAPIRYMDFLRAGLPVTLATTAVGILLLWVLVNLGLL